MKNSPKRPAKKAKAKKADDLYPHWYFDGKLCIRRYNGPGQTGYLVYMHDGSFMDFTKMDEPACIKAGHARVFPSFKRIEWRTEP